MFGIFNSTDNESLAKKKNQTDNSSDSPCFGGLSSRLEYEQCKKPRGTSPAAAALCMLMCAFFGVIGTCAGYFLFDFVQNNKPLYYPNGVPSEQSESFRVDRLSSASGIKPRDYEVVTENQSKLYRIPRGVMICAELDSHNSLLLPGDIIIAVNGSEITEVEQLTDIKSQDIETLRIFRKNKYIDISVTPSN